MSTRMIRVLEIAEPRGERHDEQRDFHFATVGELAILGFQCDSPACGCWWSWDGLDSGGGSTAARVAVRRMTYKALTQEIYEKLRPRKTAHTDADVQREARHQLAAMRQIAEVFELGEVLERNRGTARARKEQA